MKKFVLIAGLPASGKDTVAEIFQKNNFFIMTYSKHILKPIIENTQKYLKDFIQETIGKIEENKLKEIIEKIEKFKRNETRRNLYISVAMYLNEIITELTNNKFKHFCLFGKSLYDKNERIAFAGFRIKDEIDVLKNLYEDAKIITILVKCADEKRYERIQKRDNIKIREIEENEKYEREATYNILIKKVKFDYIIENNFGLEELKSKIFLILNQNKVF